MLFLQKAAKLLGETETMRRAALFDAAGRNSYLSAFHAAQALIFERTGKVTKTHAGVQSEFLRLTKNDPSIDAGLRAFLIKSYDLKAIADYEVGPDIGVSAERAAEAMTAAGLFLDRIAKVLQGQMT